MVELNQERENSNHHLSDRWFALFRIIWLMIAIYTASLLITALPAEFKQNPNMSTIGTAIICLTSLLVSVLIFWQKPNDRMALITSFTLLGLSTAFFSDLANILPDLNPLWFWLYDGLSVVFGSMIFLFFYLFPDGRFMPRWTRLLAPLVIGFSLVSIYWWEAVDLFLWPLPMLILGGGLTAQIFRYRYISTPSQRQQTKWVVYGISVAIALIIVGIGAFEIISEMPSRIAAVGNLIIGFGFLLIPLSIGIAILRYRLFDIDVIIRKTLVYGALTLTLALVYFGSVVLLQSLVNAGGGQQSAVITVISTLLIAALFSPLHRRIQSDIDRRFYRKKYDAEKTVAAFSAGLRQEVDLEQIGERLLSVVEETMQPESVSLWMKRVNK